MVGIRVLVAASLCYCALGNSNLRAVKGIGAEIDGEWPTGFIAPSEEEARLKRKTGKRAQVKRTSAEPEIVNWIARGFATPVKNQGNCASCHTVAGLDMLAARLYRDNQVLHDLSAQYPLDCLVGDCAPKSTNYIAALLSHLSDYPERGLPTYNQMPLTAANNTDWAGPLDNPPPSCSNRFLGATSTTESNFQVSWGAYFTNDELMALVQEHGPVMTGIRLPPGHGDYTCGIMDEKEWPLLNRNPSHLVLLVGYNYTGDLNTSYWVFKNTYGKDWGFGGYFAVRMNGDLESNPPGHFGVNYMSFYVTGTLKESRNRLDPVDPVHPFGEDADFGSILCNFN